jgi:hypothetical protein
MTYNLAKPYRTAIHVPDLVSSSQDFGVEQFFQADDFRADDPSPFIYEKNRKIFRINYSNLFYSNLIPFPWQRATTVRFFHRHLLTSLRHLWMIFSDSLIWPFFGSLQLLSTQPPNKLLNCKFHNWWRNLLS